VLELHHNSSLSRLTGRLIDLWPDHRDYVEKSFAGRSPETMAVSEDVATCTLKLADAMKDGLDGLVADYRFLCEKIVLPEEFYFRRNNKYRLSKFEDAMRECYANAPYMARYMNGLLVSNVVWNNHAQAIASYVREYLPSLSPGCEFLEIGPGHGLFTYFAATSPHIQHVTGWDVSPTSIDHTRDALKVLGVTRPVTLTLQNLFEATPEGSRFDSIVMSEILEHLEDPVAALKAAMAWLKPGGSIWVNVPANSPAPDHVFLVDSPEHACELLAAAGLAVTASHAFPMTGTTLERARKQKLAISCVVVGRSAA
jgi:2-polyprenyl-3-methyl-5-hydroxy-6-metoxy-1,4-benzoquinol methylase